MSREPRQMGARVGHVILDRDGTLNRESVRGWLSEPAQWEWEEGVVEALQQLSKTGVLLSVVTNQSGIGRGMVSQAKVDRLHAWLRAELASAEVSLVGIYVCPHAPGTACECRKPRPGLVRQAVDASGVSVGATLLIGDDERDLAAGRAAGVEVALVCTGKGERLRDQMPPDTLIFDNLLAAATCIARRNAELAPQEP